MASILAAADIRRRVRPAFLTAVRPAPARRVLFLSIPSIIKST